MRQMAISNECPQALMTRGGVDTRSARIAAARPCSISARAVGFVDALVPPLAVAFRTRSLTGTRFPITSRSCASELSDGYAA
jgi:hypothetical protein